MPYNKKEIEREAEREGQALQKQGRVRIDRRLIEEQNYNQTRFEKIFK